VGQNKAQNNGGLPTPVLTVNQYALSSTFVAESSHNVRDCASRSEVVLCGVVTWLDRRALGGSRVKKTGDKVDMP
jgi:hypothetical protein